MTKLRLFVILSLWRSIHKFKASILNVCCGLLAVFVKTACNDGDFCEFLQEKQTSYKSTLFKKSHFIVKI